MPGTSICRKLTHYWVVEQCQLTETDDSGPALHRKIQEPALELVGWHDPLRPARSHPHHEQTPPAVPGRVPLIFDQPVVSATRIPTDTRRAVWRAIPGQFTQAEQLRHRFPNIAERLADRLSMEVFFNDEALMLAIPLTYSAALTSPASARPHRRAPDPLR